MAFFYQMFYTINKFDFNKFVYHIYGSNIYIEPTSIKMLQMFPSFELTYNTYESSEVFIFPATIYSKWEYVSSLEGMPNQHL